MSDNENATGLPSISLSDLTGNGTDPKYVEPDVIDAPKKRGRPKEQKHVDGPQVRAVRSPLNDATMSYLETYSTPANMINNSITELNDLEIRINQDLEAVRSSRTLKSKYLYIANLTGALTSTIGTKISAVRELRQMIDQANNFELKRQQQLKINEQDSDDKIIADMYNAYLNYNPGSLNGGPGRVQMNIPASYTNLAHNDAIPVGIGVDGNPMVQTSDPGFEAYLKNMTPQQNAMLMDSNPFVETVLVYDQSTQNKWFEVIDTRTGAMVPNMEVPNDFVKDGCVVDIRKGIARNASLNQTYKLKLVGFRAEDEF
jgi:hypothetical protein